MPPTESALDRAQTQLKENAPNLNRPRAEAALARAKNRISVASNLQYFLSHSPVGTL